LLCGWYAALLPLPLQTTFKYYPLKYWSEVGFHPLYPLNSCSHSGVSLVTDGGVGQIALDTEGEQNPPMPSVGNNENYVFNTIYFRLTYQNLKIMSCNKYLWQNIVHLEPLQAIKWSNSWRRWLKKSKHCMRRCSSRP